MHFFFVVVGVEVSLVFRLNVPFPLVTSETELLPIEVKEDRF